MNAACLPMILFSPASAMTARSRRHSTAVRSVMKNGEESMACRKMPVERTSILALKCLSIFCDDGLPPVRLCPDAGTRKRKCPGGEFRGRGKKQISYLQGVVTMSDETVKVKEIHASLERIRRISMYERQTGKTKSVLLQNNPFPFFFKLNFYCLSGWNFKSGHILPLWVTV